MRLTDLPLRQPAYVDWIDWAALTPSEGQRLREFGLCEGASVEALHHGGFLGKGPIACKVGRMTIAMRRAHATAITVRTGPEMAETEKAA
ncbi:FeoA family protein [Sphingobium sp. HBC34]|uniref:FeoA family protein n=1 Tax=Sphingobium cyanobacteriorum TaxID=3063954 RepID=A0ABT8ZMX0_9SPHN|nr:FeoA family protein [Sphingobium sp. HBC34]MDO7835894.1 FeoA family protein [Sphingobium sp. HBC34]